MSAPADDFRKSYACVRTPEAFAEFLAELRKQKRFAFDLETTSLEALRSETVGISFSWDDGRAYYLPIMGPTGEQVLDKKATLDALKPIFEDAAVAKVNQNIKFDWLALNAQGIIVKGIAGDSMIAHYLLHAGERTHGLDDMTRTYLRHENTSITELIGKGKSQKRMDEVEVDKVSDYACEDADAAWRLTNLFEQKLADENLRKLYDDVEVPLIDVLARVESTGIRVDVDYLRKLSARMASQLVEIEAEIHAAAGREFNIASLKQLREVLFTEMKLPVQRRTGISGEASTDQETLEKVSPPRPPERRPAAQDRRIPAGLEAQGHLRRCPARTRVTPHRPHSHVVQPDDRLDGPAVVVRPELAEHPRPHRPGQGNSSGVPARRGLEADDRRLFAGRATIVSPLRRRPGTDPGLRRGPRYSRQRRGRGLLRARGSRSRTPSGAWRRP